MACPQPQGEAMRRRSIAGGGKAAKTRRRKTVTLKRRNAPKTPRQSGSSAASPETEVARLTRELHEALEQRTATAEVLKIISASPTELQPVLEAVVRSAARFCEADDVTIFELNGQDLRIAAHWGVVPQDVGARFPCVRGHVVGRTVLERKPVHVIDLQAEAEEFPEGSAFARRLGHRTTAAVPLLREGVAVGTISLRRAEVNPFTDKQIALLGTFAAQAVIAIENARLLTEQKEANERQTATSEVLQVISSSPGELEPVFQAMLANATRLCEASFGVIWLCDGDAFRSAAIYGALPTAYIEQWRTGTLYRPSPHSGLATMRRTRKTVQMPDQREARAYLEGDVLAVTAVELGGIRTLIVVPMFKEDDLIGGIAIYRREVRLFTDKQIDLVTNFAKQAVIAIENARLFEEVRAKTRDLEESLQQQTATSEVLQVISSSPGELKPVFQALLENATRVCGANFGTMYRYDGAFHLMASHNAPPALVEARMRTPVHLPPPDTGLGRLERTKQVVHIHDITTEPGYATDHSYVAGSKLSGARTILLVPMLMDAELVGSINIFRQEVRPFTDSRSSCSATSPNRPSSRSRIHGC